MAQSEMDSDLNPEVTEESQQIDFKARVKTRIEQVKQEILESQQQMSEAQSRLAEDSHAEIEVSSHQRQQETLQETLISLMKQYADLMAADTKAAGVLPMWAETKPGLLITVAA